MIGGGGGERGSRGSAKGQGKQTKKTQVYMYMFGQCMSNFSTDILKKIGTNSQLLSATLRLLSASLGYSQLHANL